MMKKNMLFCMMLVVAGMLAGCGNSSSRSEGITKTFVEQNGHLAVKGTFLVNDRGEKVVLKGVSYGWHNWWPRFYNESTVALFAGEWNCNVVRAAMGIGPEGSYLDNPELGIECVTKVADAAIKHGIYVIIDWHSHGIHTDEAKEFFAQMATRYKGVPNVIYEVFNEPVEDSWEDIKAYSEEVIRTIRAIDPNNVILIGSPHWDQDVHLAADSPIVGHDNLMYTLHFYAATHHQHLRDRGDYALGRGLPLFVSECAAMEASGDGPIDRDEWTAWLQWMERHCISWVAWSVSDKDETCSMLYPTAASTGPWADGEIKEWGLTVRQELTGNQKK